MEAGKLRIYKLYFYFSLNKTDLYFVYLQENTSRINLVINHPYPMSFCWESSRAFETAARHQPAQVLARSESLIGNV